MYIKGLEARNSKLLYPGAFSFCFLVHEGRVNAIPATNELTAEADRMYVTVSVTSEDYVLSDTAFERAFFVACAMCLCH